MSYSGVQPTFGTFPSDLFTANGSNTLFTMSSVPGNDAALLVTIDGVRQHTDTYSYSANTLTFSEAPPNGAVIETVNMGSRADVIITDGVYRKTQFTATAAQTNFNISTGYTVGFVDVYLNGIRLVVADDFTANDGSTIILASAAALGDSVEVVAYGTFNVANALQKSGDTMSGNFVVSGTSTFNAPVAIANTTGNTVVFANTGVVTFTNTITSNGNIITSGNVAIGSGTFNSMLDVNGPQLNANSVGGYTTASLRYNGGAAANSYGPGLTFSQYWYTSSNSSITTGAISGVKTQGDGNFGGGLAFFSGAAGSSALTERMRIDDAGRVTIPSQPSFFAKMAGSEQAITSGQADVSVYMNSTDHNVGSCYNTSTGVFTAPVAGLYHFDCGLYAYPTSSVEIYLLVNNSNYQRFHSIPPAASNVNPNGVRGSTTIKLAANDAVKLQYYVATNCGLWNGGPRSTFFAGYLVG